MPVVILLIFPLIIAFISLFLKSQKSYALVVRSASAICMLISVCFVMNYFNSIVTFDLFEFEWLKTVVLAVEVLMVAYIIYTAFKRKSPLVGIFALVQILLVFYFEFGPARTMHIESSIFIDRFSLLMILIIGVIGSLICVYAVEYMKDYHRHHKEIKDRRNIFFAVLFVFLSAMFGIVIFNDMSMILFCWEITSFCSFILISYTKTAEAIKNSLFALTINVGGGLAFTLGLVIIAQCYGVGDFISYLALSHNSGTVMLATLLFVLAGLTKAAQMPFSRWLLGAMVAPTPSSALLHSSTMVKAGVYLIIRISPQLGNNIPGITTSLIGIITFLVAAFIAVSQSDAKKILAYSTISNLGLIVSCAGINTAESLWAAILLVVFHAIAKSLLFLTVGSTEHQLGSRDVEDMDGLYRISPVLTMFLVIGIAGMFLAPFGMLISKWAAMKAFLDSGNALILLFVAFGSTVTLFFWTKWMGNLVANAHVTEPQKYIMRIDEKVSLYCLAGLVIIVCIFYPIISGSFIIPYLDENMYIDFMTMISKADDLIIKGMISILFLMPIGLIPLYRKYRVKRTSVYLSGENTGDNESFHGSMGKDVKFELKNLYLNDIFGEKIWSGKTKVLSAGILITGFCIIIGGMIF